MPGAPNKSVIYRQLIQKRPTQIALHGESKVCIVRSWRLIVEKPFGNDLSSAIALDAELWKELEKKQIYRIDHFAGKDAVLDIPEFRFSNPLFQAPPANGRCTDSMARVRPKANQYRLTVPSTTFRRGFYSFLIFAGPARFRLPHVTAKSCQLSHDFLDRLLAKISPEQFRLFAWQDLPDHAW